MHGRADHHSRKTQAGLAGDDSGEGRDAQEAPGQRGPALDHDTAPAGKVAAVVQPAELGRTLCPGHGGPERHRGVRHLVRAAQFAVVDPVRRLRHRPHRTDPLHQPAEGAPADPDRRGSRGGPGPGHRPGGGPGGPAGGRAALFPGGRVRGRRRLRPRRGIPRLLGHPAGSPDCRRHPARRKHRRAAVTDCGPGLESAGAVHRHGGQFPVGTERQLRQRAAPHRRALRRRRPRGHPGRPPHPDPRRASRTARPPT